VINRFVLASMIVAVVSAVVSGQDLRSLSNELKRINTDSALVVPSQAVDEYPLWSPEGKFLAANVEGKWYKIDLAHLSLQEGTWRGGKKIGVITSKASASQASKEEIENWQKSSTLFPRKVTTTTGTVVELKESGLGVSLIVTRKGRRSITLWTTDMENCHSLVLSPDQSFVAFISETSGVVVLRL
jgi:hypothetical protein